MHDNAPQTTPSGTPRPIETAADARSAISELTMVMDGLEAVVSEETRLVRAGAQRASTRMAICGWLFNHTRISTVLASES